MQEIVYGDVAATLMARIRERLGPTIPVRRSTPNDPTDWGPTGRPDRFVLVFRTGGQKADTRVSERAQITYEAWAETPGAALALCQQVRAIIGSLECQRYGGLTFYEFADFSAAVDLPDPESRQSRFTGTISIHVRAAQVVDVV